MNLGFLQPRTRHDISDPLRRVLVWRAHSFAPRTAQALLVATLAWIASSDLRVTAWLLAATAAIGFDTLVSRHVLRRPASRAASAAACVAHAAASFIFLSIAAVLLTTPSPMRLAECAVLLCAMCLNNAMMASGSRLATGILVGPPSLTLMLCPLIARQAGLPLPWADALLLSASAVIYTVFIVRLAASINAEGMALRAARDAEVWQSGLALSAGREATAGKRRWRMIFDQSPLPHACFNAAPLHRLLSRRIGEPGEGAGQRLRGELRSVADLFQRLRLLEANRAASALCGAAIDEAHFTEAFLEPFCRALDNLTPDGVAPPFEAELIKADGGLLAVQVHLRFAPHEQSPWGLCLATYVDISEARRAAEAQACALAAAEDASRIKTEFLGLVSHEMRTPLNGVLGMAQALAMEDGLTAGQARRVAIIQDSGSTLLSLLDEILDLATMEAGDLALEAADFDLGQVMERIAADYRPEAERRGLRFDCVIDPAIEGVYHGDAARLRQIIANLVSNAIKFTHAGAVEVWIGDCPRGVRCEVRDTGIGIPPDRVAGLFGPFVQVDGSVTRRYGGAGIGLALSSRLCELMGGRIGVDSVPGLGSVFHIELPMRPGSAVAAATPPASEPPSGRLRVLAAEDNPVNQAVLRALLEPAGVSPEIVDDGAAAVAAWEAHPWDVILMDVQMPGMDGPAAARAIRAREAETGRPRTPIIAVTANAAPDQITGYRAAGMDAVVAKPINAAVFFGALSDALAPVAETPAQAVG